MQNGARSISDWCRHRGVSRASFYIWEKTNPSLVPLAIRLGRRRVVTDEADAEWHERRMQVALDERKAARK